MRASIILVVIVGLFAASQAVDLSALTDIGVGLVNQAVEKGKSMLMEFGQKMLGSLMTKFGKRDLSKIASFAKGLHSKLSGAFQATKDLAQKTFKNAMDKLAAIKAKWQAKIGQMKDTKDVNDEIDDVVAENHVAQKRFITDLIQKGKDLFNAAVAKGKELLGSVKDKASEVVSNLLQSGANVLVGKRGTLGDHLSNIGSALSGAVAPFKDIVAGLGNTLKGHFSNLVDTVKGHASALSGKLSGHVADLKTHGKTLLDHGKNALGALSEVVKDILQQTVSNAGPAIDGLAKTASDAGSTVLNHFGGSN